MHHDHKQSMVLHNLGGDSTFHPANYNAISSKTY
jgi:hypothetical protein